MLKTPRFVVLLALAVGGGALAQPIRVAPANPHYYFYQGKPVLLITSPEHYGAVINKDFVVSGVSAPQYHRALSEQGKQYALYIHRSSEKPGAAYTVVPGRNYSGADRIMAGQNHEGMEHELSLAS